MENQIRKPDPVTITSADINEERKTQLRQLFPEAFTEGKVDFAKLRAALGDLVDDRPERYSFTWAGKQDAIRILQTPTSATLIPAPDESVDFNNTQNIFIEGDNLEVLKLLYKAYFGRVKMIYIDPPYNTGNDFIYPDNYADPLDTYLQITGQKDAKGNLLTTNNDTSGRFHSTWMNMLYPRLFIARQLLREDGIIFISADDSEIYNLRLMMNEVFGEENFVDCIIWKKRYGGGAKEKYLVTLHEYVLFYAKNIDVLDNIHVPLDEKSIERYYKSKDSNFAKRGPYRTHPLEATKSVGVRDNLVYPIPGPNGEEIWPKRQWWWEKTRVERALEKNELEFVRTSDGGWTVHTKQYLKDGTGKLRQTKAFSIIDDVYTQHGTAEIGNIFGDSRVFTFPKPTKLIERLMEIANLEDEDIVVDFFAGAGTTAESLLRINKQNQRSSRFILIQLPEPISEKDFARKQGFESIADIGKERIRRVVQQMKAEDEGKLPLQTRETPEDLGFKVFKLAPTNFRSWEGTVKATPEEFASQMELFTDPLVDGWRPANVIYEIALKEGYSLNCYIQRTAVSGHEVYRVNDQEKDQHFYLCLENAITENLPAKLNLSPDDLFICRDISLDDTMAANLALQCRLKTI